METTPDQVLVDTVCIFNTFTKEALEIVKTPVMPFFIKHSVA